MARTRMTDADRPEVARFIEQHWNSKVVMSRGRTFTPHQEDGFLERRKDELVGLITFRIDEEGMELLTENSTLAGQGIGSALLLETINLARKESCPKVWLTTTNDRLRAIRFYQRLGFRMTNINVGVVDEARKIKPQIPEIGEGGIAVHDEIVLELAVQPYLDARG